MALILQQLENRTLLSGTASPTYVLDRDAGPAGSPTPPTTALSAAQLRAAYGFDNISFGSVAGNGSGQTIAIIDAYDDPDIASDLATYDTTYGLPSTGFTFTKDGETSNGTLTSTLPAAAGTNGWDIEESLDVELVHGMAPQANILLVEADSNSFTDLFNAVAAAKTDSAVSVVSMSFSGGEFSGETSYDSIFTSPSSSHGITYLAATGDDGSPSGYPAYSPNVVAVGGTTLNVSGDTYDSETGWSGSGGGISADEAKPTYQDSVTPTESTTYRMNPDVSFDADPNTGVAVYDSYSLGGWAQYGGTSMATPAWASLIAIVDQGRAANGLTPLDGATQTLPDLYALENANPAAFHDITAGSNGGYSAGVGYDLVTGIGSPIANVIVGELGAAPTVTSVTPNSGPNAGGTAVTITGTNFTNVDTVDFGGIAATNVDVVSSTQITATASAGTGTVDVTVDTPSFTSSTSAADQFTYSSAVSTTFSGGVLTLDYTAANQAVTITDSSASLLLAGSPISGAGAGPFTGVTSIVAYEGISSTGQSLTVAGGTTFALSGGFSSAGIATVTFNDAVDTSSGSGSLTVTGAATIAVNAQMKSGAGALTLAATDSITLSASLTTTSGFMVISGGLTGSGNIVMGGPLSIADYGVTTYSGVISGTATVLYEGTGVLTFSGANTWTGTTDITAGTMIVSGSTQFTNLSILSSGDFVIDSSTALVSSCNVSNTGTLNLNGFSPIIGSLNGSGLLANTQVYQIDDGVSAYGFNDTLTTESEDDWNANVFTAAAGETQMLSISFLDYSALNSSDLSSPFVTAALYTGAPGAGLTLIPGSVSSIALNAAEYSWVTVPFATPQNLAVGQVFTAALLIDDVPVTVTPFVEDASGSSTNSYYDVDSPNGAVNTYNLASPNDPTPNGVDWSSSGSTNANVDTTFLRVNAATAGSGVSLTVTGGGNYSGTTQNSGGNIALIVAGTSQSLTLSSSTLYGGGITVDSSDTLLVGGSLLSNISVLSGGTLGGSGTTGPLTVAGTVKPSGVLTASSASFSNGSNLTITVAGTPGAVNVQEFVVSGALTLPSTSTLTINMSGFISSAAGSITILTDGSETGQFSAVNVVNNANNLQTIVNQAANSVTLTVVPTVTANSANLPVNSTALTINGVNFDTNTAHDSVSFDNGVSGTVTAATDTSLTVSLTELSSVAIGTALHAQVTIDDVGNAGPVQVATVSPIAPIVTANTANLNDSVATITINGSNFSTNTASDSVVFSLGVMGSVTSATASQLVVTVSTPPTALGSLTAVVTTSGVTSGLAVQVGTVVWDSVVTRLSPDNANEVGTLRYALASVQSGVPITFEPGLSGGTITLASALTLIANVTITGLGAANLAISGNHTVRVFVVDSGVTASIASLTIENGFTGGSGGGVDNSGTLSLSSDSITGSTGDVSGGGIYNSGSLALGNSTLSSNYADYGGAIATISSMTVTNSFISHNTGDYSAGGIEDYGGTLTVSDSTLAYNTASVEWGGAVATFNDGNLANATLIDDTIYGNSAATDGGGVANYEGTISLANDTIVGNTGKEGGGVWIAGGYAVTMANTLVAGNSATASNEYPDVFNQGTTTTNNDVIGNTYSQTFTGTGNVLNPTYVGLSSLGNYGGPTQTIALLPGSPAIDAGNNSYVSGTKDQRGLTRIVNGTVDIGADESQGFLIAVVSGNNQSANVSSAFSPLVVSVTAVDPLDPVNGGDITWTANQTADGATATVNSLAAISGGQATVTPTANAAAGVYSVTATARSASPATFTLTNKPTVTTSTAYITGSTLTIAGVGFDPMAGNDQVTFSNGVAGTISSAAATSLTVNLTGLGALAGGTALNVSVTVDGASSGAAVQVGTVGYPTTTTLTDNGPNPSLSGTPVSFTVNVSSGTPISGETVSIEDTNNNTVVATPTLTSGTATFTISSLSVGNQSLIAIYNSDGPNASSQSTTPVSQNVQATFGVAGVTVKPNGVVFTFNAPIDPTTTVLYASPGDTTLGAADVTVVGATTGTVRGSLVIDPTNPYMATFVQTIGLLAPDVYTATVTSAVKAVGGSTLGGNYTTTFTVTSSTAPVLSVPNFARGPGQTVALSDSLGNMTGIPVNISKATNATQASFTLTYDPTLLTIAPTGALTLSSLATAAGINTVNYSITAVDAHDSVLAVTLSSSVADTGLTTTPAETLVTIAASVPDSAPYRNKAVLNLSSVTVNGATGVGASGVDVAAYFGDVSGSGTVNALSASLVDQVGSGAGTGFSAYQDLDPAIIGAVNGSAFLSATGASLINEAASGAVIPQIPAVPTFPQGMTLSFGGPDPYLYLGAVQASAGGTVTETLYLDVTDPNGIQLSAIDEAIGFDAGAVQISNVHSAASLAGLGSYATASTVDNTSGVLLAGQAFAGTGLPPVVPYGTDVAVLQFDVTLNTDATPESVTGLTLLQNGTVNGQTKYTAISDNEGALTWTAGKAPSNSGNAAIDGSVTVVAAPAPAVQAPSTAVESHSVVVRPKVITPVRRAAPVQSTIETPAAVATSGNQALTLVGVQALSVDEVDISNPGPTLSAPVVLVQPEVLALTAPVTVSPGVTQETVLSPVVATSTMRSADPGSSLSLALLGTNRMVPVVAPTATLGSRTSTTVLDEMYRQFGMIVGVPSMNASSLGMADDDTSEELADIWALEVILSEKD